jgi:hypothetical protein
VTPTEDTAPERKCFCCADEAEGTEPNAEVRRKRVRRRSMTDDGPPGEQTEPSVHLSAKAFAAIATLVEADVIYNGMVEYANTHPAEPMAVYQTAATLKLAAAHAINALPESLALDAYLSTRERMKKLLK